MKPTVCKADAKAWMKRWEAINKAQKEELRATSVEDKFRQLSRLMDAARRLGWHSSTEEETQVVRDRWLRLKRGSREA